jgi:hypothetical protein
MSAPETLMRARIKEVVEDEFTVEGYEVGNDKLGRSAGKDGTVLAVSPVRSPENTRNVMMLEPEALLQIYLEYEPVPDENIVVNPDAIEAIADRLRRAFSAESGGTGDDFWFLRLRSIEYPDDPTGNKTRLEARFTAWAHNPAGTPT